MHAQLTFLEREKISQMLFSKASSIEIAKVLGRSISTISREIRRNSMYGGYLAANAQIVSRNRRFDRSIERKMERLRSTSQFVPS